MGTPEDVATGKYFTPPTLTEALFRNLQMEARNDAETEAIDDTLTTIKSVFKEWLRTVNLGDSPHPNEVESTRTLIMTLVDEP